MLLLQFSQSNLTFRPGHPSHRASLWLADIIGCAFCPRLSLRAVCVPACPLTQSLPYSAPGSMLGIYILADMIQVEPLLILVLCLG